MTREEPTPRLIVVPAGEFVMGGGADDKFTNDTERPAHLVRVPTFEMGRTPVTVAEFRAFRPNHAPDDEGTWPVVGVSWQDAQAYCQWLSARTARRLRLPTEAEWEYACRAGTTGSFSHGAELTKADANFYYDEQGHRVGPGRRTSVASYSGNAFGLHDLHGNVCEWVEDAWHSSYEGAPQDGAAWTGGDDPPRVIRGGAWDGLPRLLRSSWRDALPADSRRDNLGFRVAASL